MDNCVQWVRRRVGRHKIFLVFASVVLLDERGHILLTALEKLAGSSVGTIHRHRRQDDE